MRLDFKPYLSIKVILTSSIVFLGVIVLFRLGLWQISRFYERQAFNNQYLTQQNAPILNLNQNGLEGLAALEYRRVRVTGVYDHKHAIARVNQVRDGQLGFALMTPLVLEDGKAIYVDRGWVPSEGEPGGLVWSKYEINGPITIEGILRKATALNGYSDHTRPGLWVDFYPESLRGELSYEIPNEFIQPIPNGETEAPFPEILTVEITEGPHLSYAFQWFTFGIMLLLGYPFVLRKSSQRQRMSSK